MTIKNKNLICVCGCPKNYHTTDVDIVFHTTFSYCALCFDTAHYDHRNPKRGFHKFKLDNLKYIEDLAKERNLV
jgi:hypothetical protein